MNNWKFRIYYKNEKEQGFEYFDTESFLMTNSVPFEDIISIGLFTGFYDIYNKEIYQNDIITTTSSSLPLLVSWCASKPGFRLQIANTNDSLRFLDIEKYIIISNIYKNKGDLDFFIAKLKMNPKTAIHVCVIKNYIKLSNFFIDNYCKLSDGSDKKVRVGYENNKLFIVPTDNDDIHGCLIIRRKKENYGYIYCRSSLKKYNINRGVFSIYWDQKRKYLIITLKNKSLIQFSDSNI